MPKISCQCPDTTPCENNANQEDLLCDRCREPEHRARKEAEKVYLYDIETGDYLYREGNITDP